MKPDVNNPGPVEATQSVGKELESTTPKPEQTPDKIGELPISSSPPAQNPAAAATQVPSGLTPVTTAQSAQPVVTGSAKDQFESQLAQLPAEDADVIEKVWVEKANEIVDKTKDDPFLEDEAQHSLSRAYLKKRFNLDVD